MWRGAGPIGLSVAFISGPLTCIALLAMSLQKHNVPISFRWDLRHQRTLLLECKELGLQAALSAIRERIEQLLVPKLVGISTFGYYSAGTILSDRLAIVPDGLSTAFYPQIASAYARSPREGRRYARRLVAYTLAACIPIAMALSFLAPLIARILFPKHAEDCRMVIHMTSFALPFLGASVPMGSALQAIGKHNEAARASMVAMSVSLGASVILIARFGVTGACISYILRPTSTAAALLPRFAREFSDTRAERLPAVNTAN